MGSSLAGKIWQLPHPESRTMTDELLPCPFCGHVGLDFDDGSTFRWLLPSCSNCGATRGEVRIQTTGNGTPEDWRSEAERLGIEAWSTRYNAAEPVYLERTCYVEYQESFNEVTLKQYQKLEPKNRRILYAQPTVEK